MRAIQFNNGRISRSNTDIPDGNTFFVDERGSAAIINNALYVNGERAPKGTHKIIVGNKELPVDVDSKGNAMRGRPVDINVGYTPSAKKSD